MEEIMKPDHSTLHYFVMRHIVDMGYAPKISKIAARFDVSNDEVIHSLKALEEYHGVALHPKSFEIWVMHPFANAPTNFWITSNRGGWWGNCAWCSLGTAALLDEDVSIITTLGAESKQIVVEIKDGKVLNENLHIHFPVPMVNAWDNVIFTCSTILLFDSEAEIDRWCDRHGIAKGDVQPIQKIWEFSKVWYGNHLNPDWVKWTAEEAKNIFERFGLVSPTWNIPPTSSRF
jgi:hypothetical protein